MNIIQCTDEHAAQWDAFVARHAGTYCHRYGWGRIFQQSYGLKVFNLVFEDTGEWQAVLPLTLLPWPLHKKAVSLPFSCYGGILPGTRDELFPLLTHWMRENDIRSLQLRYLGDTDDGISHDVTMIRTLPPSVEELLASFSYYERRELKRSKKKALEIRWGLDQFDDFYAVYADNIGRLGTPAHSRQYMRAHLDNFAEAARIVTARHEGQVVGAMLLFCENEGWINMYTHLLWKYRHLRPSRQLYYEAMAAAIREGATFFDFGRSRRNSGTWEFKRRMGAEEKTLHYITLYSDGSRTTAGGTQAYYGKAGQTAATCWRLLPVKLQNTLGPFIRKFVP